MKNFIQLSIIITGLCWCQLLLAQQEFYGELIDLPAGFTASNLPAGSVAFSLHTASLNTYVKDNASDANFTLKVGEELGWTFNLEEKNGIGQIIGNNNGTLTEYERGEINTYSGIYDGNHHNTTHWLIRDDVIRADIGESMTIRPLEEYISGYGSDAYIIIELNGNSAGGCDHSNIQPASDYPERIIDLAIDVDNRLLNIYGGVNNDVDEVIELVEEKMAEVEAVYRNTFNVQFNIVLINVWETERVGTNNSARRNEFYNPLASYWATTFECLRYDMLLALKAKFNGASGKAWPRDLCNWSFPPACVAETGLLESSTITTIAHEIGHLLNAGHETTCCVEDPSIMCQGTGGNLTQFSEYSQREIKSGLEFYNDCLQEAAIQTDCPFCSLTASLSGRAEYNGSFANCWDEDTNFRWKAKICNHTCTDETVNIDLELGSSLEIINLIDFEGATITQRDIPNEEVLTNIILNNVPIDAGACIEMEMLSSASENLNFVGFGARVEASGFDQISTDNYLVASNLLNRDGLFPAPTTEDVTISELINTDRWSGTFQDPPICPIAGRRILYFTDDLIIDRDYCFGGIDLEMSPEAEIIVQSGINLDISDCNFYSCDGLWKGFRLEPGARLIMDDVTISDALYAIEMEPGSELSLTNTDFQDNYIGVYSSIPVPRVAFSFNSPIIQFFPFLQSVFSDWYYDNREPIYIYSFSGNTFKTVHGLNDGYDDIVTSGRNHALAGVWTQGITGVNIAGTIDDDVENFNHFENLINGIVGISSVLNVEGCTFNNIHDDSNGQGPNSNIKGHGIYAGGVSFLAQKGTLKSGLINFNECDYGITSHASAIFTQDNFIRNCQNGIQVNSPFFFPVRVHDNNIEAEIGIALLGGTFLGGGRIDNNEISINQDQGIGLNIAGFGSFHTGWNIEENIIQILSKSAYGIRAYNSQKDDIVDNLIDISDGSGGYGIYQGGCNNMSITNSQITGDDQSSGIYSYNSFESNISCNNTIDCFSGIQYVGLNDGSFHSGNTASNCTTGLLLGAESNGDVIIGSQYHQGNIWSRPFQNSGAEHLSESRDIVNRSRFWVDASENANFRPQFIAVIDDWFTDENNNGETYDCPDQKTYIDIDPTDIKIAEYGIPFVVYREEMSRTAAHHLYQRLYSQGESNNPAFIAFKNDSKQDEIKSLHTVHSNLYDYHTANQVDLDKLEASIDDLMSSLGKSNDSDNLNQEITEMQQAISKIDESLYSFSEKIGNQLSQMSSTQSNLFSEHPVDKNLIAFNGILIDALKGQVIRNQSKEDLKKWADSCPNKEGDVVFKARAFLSMIGMDQEIKKPASCNDNIKFRSTGGSYEAVQATSKDDNLHLSIYPNPAHKFLKVSFVSADSINRTMINLYDMQGKGVLTKDLAAGINQSTLDVSTINNGMYILEISQGEYKQRKKCMVITN